jgi:hypothetical protein
MDATTIKTLMTLVGIVAGAAMLVPQLVQYQAALSALSAGLLAWAHGKRPGDVTESQTAEVQKRKEDETPPPWHPRGGGGPAAALLVAAAVALAGGTACATLAATEAPPCDEATLAAIVASCRDEAECNQKLDERQATCTKRIQEEK